MKFFTILGIIFYTTIFSLIGLALIALSFNILNPQDINNLLSAIQDAPNARAIVGLCGILAILISFAFAQSLLARFQREKTVAFNTASGQVTISLSAVEDLIKRLAYIIPEIKELRPNLVATKKGIIADLRVILRSEANIPELTARLQELTISKIQEVLGLEEQIVTKIHVVKIISLEEKDKKRKETDKHTPTIPFGGYARM